MGAEPERAESAPPEQTSAPQAAPAAAPAIAAGPGSVGAMHALQQSAGNAAVARAVHDGRIAPGPGLLQRQPAPPAAPPAFNPIVAGPGGAGPQAVPAVDPATGDPARDLAAADAFHAGPVRGPQAIQSSSGTGGFSATYAPSADTLTITIKGSVQFEDGIKAQGGGFVPGDPGLAGVIARIPPPGPRRTAFLAAFQWTAADEAPFLTGLAGVVRGAWSGQYEFHVNRPQWQWIGARVAVDIQVAKQAAGGRAADDHVSIKAVKTPPEGTGPAELHRGEQVNSLVGGDADRTNAFDQRMTLARRTSCPRSAPCSRPCRSSSARPVRHPAGHAHQDPQLREPLAGRPARHGRQPPGERRARRDDDRVGHRRAQPGA